MTKFDPAGKQDIPRPPLTSLKAETKPRTKKAGKDDSPPPLGRKEQAARARMQSAKKAAGTSIFSTRPQIKQNGHGLTSTSSSSNGSAMHASKASSSRLPASKAPVRPVSGGGRKGKGPADVADLRALCPDRTNRDQRTIDEIQRDIKARKAGTTPVGTKPTTSPGKGQAHDRQNPSTLKTQRQSPNKRPPARRRSYSASSVSTSDSDSSIQPTRKKSRPDIGHGAGKGKTDISSMIQDLFRRPGRPPPTARYDSDSEGSDMEAGLSDVEEEERRAISIARKEDMLAEKEERERRERKEKLRRERERMTSK